MDSPLHGSTVWILSALVFLAGWIGAWLPLRGAAIGDGAWLRFGNAFASGVILGTGLLHLLPESDRSLLDQGVDYPFAPLLAGLSFLALLFVEHVALSARGHVHGDLVPHGQGEIAREIGMHAEERGFAAYALLAGLSVHSVLTGVALGVQSDPALALTLLIAVLAHKTSDGFAIGVALARHGVPGGSALRLITIFAAATPLGIGFGALLRDALPGSGGDLLRATFTAIAAGTLIYVASLDMIGEEFSHGDRPLAKWMLASAGFASTALLALAL